MEGGGGGSDYIPVGTVIRQSCEAGDLHVERRDRGHYFEVVPFGFFRLKDGSIFLQRRVKKKDADGTVTELILFHAMGGGALSKKLTSLSPILFEHPKHISAISSLELVKDETPERLRDSIKEEYIAKYGDIETETNRTEADIAADLVFPTKGFVQTHGNFVQTHG